MNAGMTSITEWHDNEMRQARNGAQKADGAVEYLLRNIFAFWAKRVDDYIKTWKRKRKAIEVTMMAISETVELAVLEAEKESLRVKRDIVRVAKGIGKLSREEAKNRRLMYGNSCYFLIFGIDGFVL